ncbi:MAG: tetratricopeptide repeat protein [Myxococcaceae bacterium]
MQLRFPVSAEPFSWVRVFAWGPQARCTADPQVRPPDRKLPGGVPARTVLCSSSVFAQTTGLSLAVLLLAASPQSLRARAEKAYRAKDYETACRLYEAALQHSKRDGALWSDWGLCLFRLGEDRLKEKAVSAEQTAVRLGNEAVRKRAYLNLDLMNEDLDPAEGCSRLPQACGKQLVVCRTKEYEGGNGGGPRVDYVEFGVPGSDGGIAPEGPTARFAVNQQEEVLCSKACVRFDWEGGWCGVTAPKEIGDALEKVRAPCLSDGGTEDACEQQVCRSLNEMHPSRLPEPFRSYRAAVDRSEQKCVEECHQQDERESAEPTQFENCRFVSADPCHMAVGVACTHSDGGTNVMEVLLK